MKIPLRRIFLPVLLIALVLAISDVRGSDPDTTIPVNQNWQLFFDRYILDRETGFDRVVHHPRPVGIVIPPDKPWESLSCAPLFVGRDKDGTFFMYYSATWWTPDPDSKLQPDRAVQYTRVGAYAISRDGLRWEKPVLRMVEGPTGIDSEKYQPIPSPTGSSKENNLIVPFAMRDLAMYGNVSNPNQHYAIYYNEHAYFAKELPDVIHDPSWTNKLVDCGGTFSPRFQSLEFWDNIHREWVAMVHAAVPHWLPAREIARFSSKDLIQWRSDIAFAADSADSHAQQDYDEAMYMTSYYSDGVVFGLLSWFHSDRSNPDNGPVLHTDTDHPYLWPWARKGAVEMRITFSRDWGRTWDRTCSREAWIPCGTEQDSYDRLVISPTVPLRVGDEDWFYIGDYNGDQVTTQANAKRTTYYSDRVRKGGIALYTQKHNRYVSLRTGRKEILITKPLTIEGKVLQLNVEANRGLVRVAIASADLISTLRGTTMSTASHLAEDNPLPGFSFDDCSPIRTNSVEYSVKFKSGSDLEGLRGRPVRVLFEITDADLYRLPDATITDGLNRLLPSMITHRRVRSRIPPQER